MSRPPRALSDTSVSALIGSASGDITPPDGIYARNWAASEHDRASGVHRPLSVTALVLQKAQGRSPWILLSLDLGWWKAADDEWLLRSAVIDTFGVDQTHVLLALTHTHAGPSTARADASRPGGELIADWLEHVRTVVINVVGNALADSRKGVLAWRTGQSDLAANRDLPHPGRVVCGYNPSLAADQTLVVGKATAVTGEIIGVVVNYACHPTVLGWQNALISPDFVGAMREVVEGVTGAPCLFLQGASGELAPRQQYTDDVTVADAQGRQLGYAVLATLEGMLPAGTEFKATGIVESGAPLATWKPHPRAVDETLEATCTSVELELVRPTTSPGRPRIGIAAVNDERRSRDAETRTNVGWDRTSELHIWSWRLGGAVVVAIPAEAYSWLQVELRRRCPDTTVVVVTCTNGCCPTYLPPSDRYGLDLYQVWQTPFARGSLERVLDIALDQCHRLMDPDE